MRKQLDQILSFSPFLIGLAVAGVVAALYLFETLFPSQSLLKLIEYRVLDYRFQLRGERVEDARNSPVVIVAIDEKTLEELGRWPFSRSYQADLVRALREYEAKVIAFDIVFSEADQNSELRKVRELREFTKDIGLTKTGLGLEVTAVSQEAAALAGERVSLAGPLSKLDRVASEIDKRERSMAQLQNFLKDSEAKADNDAYFARELSDGSDVVLGYFINDDAAQHAQSDVTEFERRAQYVLDSRISVISDGRESPSGPLRLDRYSTTYKYPVVNIPVISQAARADGHFNQIQDSDGAIRWYPAIIQYGDAFMPSLGMMAAAKYLDADPILQANQIGEVDSLFLGDSAVPLAADGRGLLNYYGAEEAFNTVSFVDVVKKRVDPAMLKGKIALIGPTAVGIYDLRNTPFDPALPGVQIHATAIANTLDGSWLTKPSSIMIVDLLSIGAIGLLMGVLGSLSSLFSGVIIAVITAGYLWFSQWMMVENGIWLTTTYQLLEIIGGFLVILIIKYMSEERKRKQIKGAFQFYLNPQVVEEVLKDPSKLKLGGEKRELSILFSDVRGFTTISEALSPEELSNLLNEYLTPMTDIVFKYEGTLDKYIGDALMAIFGAPLRYPDNGHAWRACHVALDMIDKLHELQPAWRARGLPEVDVGIGVNSGEVSVGNMGSTQRFDYTVMGDAVNLASRVEGINKNYKTNIVITEFTLREAAHKVYVRELDAVKVKGKDRPVTIYELLGKEPIPELIKPMDLFAVGLAEYRARKFHEAIKTFNEVMRLRGGHDGPSEIFIGRCDDLLLDMPPEGWDGVYTMKTK